MGGGRFVICFSEVKSMLEYPIAPAHVAGDAPRAVLTGRDEVLIEGHTGLFSYETKCIRVRTKAGLWTVTGEGLTIDFFGAQDLLIRGKVAGLALGDR